MNEKKYQRKIEFQKNIISRQSEQIESLNCEIHNLRLKIEEKDNIINSIGSLRDELKQNVEDVKKYKEQYKKLVDELKNMKKIVNQEIYRGRWEIVRWLIKL